MAPTAGRIAFLLTDVEGSTRLLARVGRRYPSMIAAHRDIIAAAAQRAGGQAVPMEGDACLATFPSATAAIRAAVEVQQALARHSWGDDPLRVRIGVHAGQAMLHDGEYFGLDLHRAARVADAGHGGQIVVSDSAREQVIDELPPGIGLLDLGVHRLPDLAAPLHLFQVTAPGLPDRFPALRTLRSDAHNLPAQTSSLVGRGEDTAALTGLLGSSRLVTLIGPGGVGKTRLALQVAANLVDAFADGVWLVELARARDADMVPGLIAAALNVDASDSSDPLGVVAEALRRRTTLLVLDNVEHVLDAAPMVSSLLAAAPDLRVLATSRERLALAGEQVCPVAPLPIEPAAGGSAATLFLERARAADPELLPSTEEMADITEICRLVDGLPLAVELAAAQTRILTIGEIRERLHEGIDALGSGPRDLPRRQRTLRETIDWSYRLLPPEEQRLFARLSVFRGGRTLPAITAVCTEGLSGDPLAGVSALADKSLLHRRIGSHGDVTFEMLGVVHEFASDVLAGSGEAERLHALHAAYIAELSERCDEGMLGPAAHEEEDVLNSQLENIRTALRWAFGGGDVRLGIRIAAALNLFWYWGGPHDDGRRWIELALGHPELLDDATLGRLHLAAGFFGFADGDQHRSRTSWEKALAAFTRAGDEARIPWMLSMLAVTYSGEPDHHDHALALADEAVQRARALDGRMRIVADTLTAKGEIARLAGDDSTAEACYREAMAIMRPTDNERYVAILTSNLAFLADHAGDHEAAHALLVDALQRSAKLGQRVFLAWTLSELAAPELGLGRPERAALLIGAADAALDRFGVARQAADQPEHDATLARLADVLGRGRLDELVAQGRQLSLDEAVHQVLEAGPSERDPGRDLPGLRSG